MFGTQISLVNSEAVCLQRPGEDNREQVTLHAVCAAAAVCGACARAGADAHKKTPHGSLPPAPQREVLKVERGLGVGSGAGSLHLGTGREPILHAARGDGGPSAHGNRPQVDLTQRSLHWQLRCAEQVDNNAQKQM